MTFLKNNIHLADLKGTWKFLDFFRDTKNEALAIGMLVKKLCRKKAF